VNDRDFCDIEISGVIQTGDLDRLRGDVNQLIGTRWPDEFDGGEPPYRPLCLNSPGGSLGEAIRIARYVHENSITTVLPPNTVCESACSWIFMLGNREGAEGGGPSRRMHYSARLAIHAPSVDFGTSETILREPVQRAFDEVIAGMGVILSVANQVAMFGTRPFIDPDFLELAFTHVGDDWFEIDTVHKAGRWRIEVFGFEVPAVLDESAAWHVCNNMTSIWMRPWTSVRERYGSATDLYSPSDVTRRGQIYIVTGIDNGYVLHSCVVNRAGGYCGVNQVLQDGPASTEEVCIVEAENQLSWIYPPWDSAPPLARFPGETRLADIPRAVTRLNARALLSRDTPAQARELPVQACWLTTPSAHITNVTEYVNLRRQPDFSAPVIRQVPLGERVRLQRADNITIIGQERDRQSCISACRAFGASREDRAARDRAQQCIADNMLWYEVTDARNNRGWVSRRYLEEVR